MSLLDVLERYSFGFYEVVLRAQRLRSEVAAYGSHESLFSHSRDEFPEFLAQLKSACADLGLTYTGGLASHAESRLAAKGVEYTHLELLSDLDALIFSFGDELRNEPFLRFPKDSEPYFQRDDLFGPEVATAFPSSAEDIQHAGTCYALGQHTASVFHSMRVLEVGLHVFADRLGVDFGRDAWGTVLDRIDAVLKKNASGPRVDAIERQVFAEAALNFRYLKDAWRNEVSHLRGEYAKGQAESVLAHVRDFMRELAKAGLSESTTSP